MNYQLTGIEKNEENYIMTVTYDVVYGSELSPDGDVRTFKCYLKHVLEVAI